MNSLTETQNNAASQDIRAWFFERQTYAGTRTQRDLMYPEAFADLHNTFELADICHRAIYQEALIQIGGHGEYYHVYIGNPGHLRTESHPQIILDEKGNILKAPDEIRAALPVEVNQKAPRSEAYMSFANITREGTQRYNAQWGALLSNFDV